MILDSKGQFGIHMRLREAKGLFLDRQRIVQRVDKVARRRLATFGGFCMRTARNMIKPKRDMREAEFPEELKALLSPQRESIQRDSKGRFLKGSGKIREAELRAQITNWPQTTGEPYGPPKYRVKFTQTGKKFNQFKNLIVFIVEASLASVVIGPVIFDRKDVPGLLEYGGRVNQWVPKWYRGWRNGQPVIETTYERKTVNHAPHPYMSTAFDRAIDAQVPRIFREIL